MCNSFTHKVGLLGVVLCLSLVFPFASLAAEIMSVGGSPVPSGAIIISTVGSCPAGYSEYTNLRGRYPVGLPSGGTNLASIGTALTDQENRPAGKHTHLLLGNSNVAGPSASGTPEYSAGANNLNANTNDGTGASTALTTAGTNAPYLQIMFCSKN